VSDNVPPITNAEFIQMGLYTAFAGLLETIDTATDLAEVRMVKDDFVATAQKLCASDPVADVTGPGPSARGLAPPAGQK
jgi:hypothetical protein